MPKISELEVKSNGHPTASRSAFLGTEEARGFEELRTHVLAQEKEKKEAERERRLDLGLEAGGKFNVHITSPVKNLALIPCSG